MTNSAKSPALVWSKERRTPRRQAPGVEQIVRTAIGLADGEGPDAVSMRRIATELESGTASLYRYVASRDDLLDLMIDAVRGEVAPPELIGDWRADLTAVATHLRDTMIRHPWLASELTGRPTLGANSLRLHDTSLSAATELTSDITDAAAIVDTVHAYVFGVTAAQLAEEQAQRRTGLTEDQWRETVAPYIREVIESNEYPNFARRVRDAADTDADQRFEFGLGCVLDGIAARVHHHY
ncbi:TetR/AcrR family transcriptional regulator [Nocardia vinacea]|uniref:TetR/AcrR family transcriptional regulator n=1 Tax=Nocardia vinacea TaxID=96468 RepID=UPI002E130C53|nr:TetR/AcrR family transcriptional regulator [Nocardia vinacea]